MIPKDTSILYSQAQAEDRAIAFFRLPGEKEVHHISGSVTRKIAAGQKAFVFAPFNTKVKPYFISPDVKNIPVKPAVRPDIENTSEEAFKDEIGAIQTAIHGGGYKKIVAARILAIDRSKRFDPSTFFDRLCRAYPSAFVSFTFIPNLGIWIGASPEVLASQDSSSLTTYALAGTKTADDNTKWGDKEVEEQRIVSYLIGQKLMRISLDVKREGPVTHEAGRLKHLLTTFIMRTKETGIWREVIKDLHPTPAVGGMPQRKAVEFIKEHESLDRRFYAGYLGPVNWSGKTDVFVNLRCMEVTDKQLVFYSGCGITADSDPDKEWLESERKIDVLRSLV